MPRRVFEDVVLQSPGHWSRGGMSFRAVSDLNNAELAEFERVLRQ
jgi:hypothetical protein